jgi:hypothetical protein
MHRIVIAIILYVATASAVVAASGSWHIAVSEPLTDVERGRWPILAQLDSGITANDASRLILHGPDGAVPFQVMTVLEPDVARVPGVAVGDHLEICFFADLARGGAQTFTLNLMDAGGIQGPAPKTTLAYEGESYGTAVDTGPVLFEFDPRSGQFLGYTPKLAGETAPKGFSQDFRQPVHWNPDVWVPVVPWGHVSDWDSGKPDLTPEFAESRGPLVYRAVRRGIMPNSNNTEAEVSYTVFAGMPFILEASRMRFTAETQAKAVRHNELVFSRGVHTHGLWPDGDGKPQRCRLYDPDAPKTFHGTPKRMRADIEWVGLCNDQMRYGINILTLAYENDARASYYFLDYGEHGTEERYHYNFSYVCRSLVSHASVAADAVFSERSAFLVYKLDEDDTKTYDEMLHWSRLLQNPPAVRVWQSIDQ